MNVENELRACFARHESLTPPAGPLQARISVAAARRRRRRGRLAAAAVTVALLSVIAVPAAWAGGLFDDSDSRIGGDSKATPVNVLVIGSDAGSAGDRPRADAVMIAHLPADRKAGYVVSVPRDLRLERGKLSGYYARGGSNGLRKAVERITGVEFAAIVEVDFDGLVGVVDALDGVRLCIETPPGTDTLRSIHKPYREFSEGCRRYDGAAALDYVRQYFQYPDGDAARMRHQQDLVRAILNRLAETKALRRPATLLDMTRDTLAISGDLNLASMVGEVSRLAGKDLTGITAPTVVVDDDSQARAPVAPDYRSLWSHLRRADLGTWADKHPKWVND